MTLLQTQRTIAAALMLPLTPEDRLARVATTRQAAKFVKPNSRLTSLERLEIYGRSYWFRLLDSLRDDFPGLAAILGPAAFERLARAYLAQCPSRSFTLRDLGSRLAKWLEKNPEYADRNRELALDMVRLEWAHIVAFDGPAEPVLGPEHLAGLKPGLRLGVQPYLSLLPLQYPVDEIRVRANADREGSAAASNAVARRGRRVPPQVRRPPSEPIFLAVHRLDLSVYYRRMCVEEFLLLSALRDGRSIAAAIRTSFQCSPVLADEVPELLTIWFRTWARFGWLTSRKKSGASE